MSSERKANCELSYEAYRRKFGKIKVLRSMTERDFACASMTSGIGKQSQKKWSIVNIGDTRNFSFGSLAHPLEASNGPSTFKNANIPRHSMWLFFSDPVEMANAVAFNTAVTRAADVDRGSEIEEFEPADCFSIKYAEDGVTPVSCAVSIVFNNTDVTRKTSSGDDESIFMRIKQVMNDDGTPAMTTRGTPVLEKTPALYSDIKAGSKLIVNAQLSGYNRKTLVNDETGAISRRRGSKLWAFSVYIIDTDEETEEDILFGGMGMPSVPVVPAPATVVPTPAAVVASIDTEVTTDTAAPTIDVAADETTVDVPAMSQQPIDLEDITPPKSKRRRRA